MFDFYFKGNKFENMSVFFYMYAEDLDAGAGTSVSMRVQSVADPRFSLKEG